MANTLSASLKVATTATSLFGRALLNAIPIIGQVLFAFSVLSPLVKKLWEDSNLEKKTNEVIKSFSSFNDIARDLAVTLGSDSISAADKYIARLRVQVGVIGQIISGLKELQLLRETERQEKLNALLIEQFELERKIAATKERGEKIPSLRGEQTGILGGTLIQLKNNLKAQEELEGIITDTDVPSALKVIAGGLAGLKVAGLDAETGTLAAFKSLQKLRVELIDASDDKIEINAKEFIDKANAIIDGTKGGLAAFDGLSEGVSAFNKEVTKLATKRLTVFDDLKDSVSSLGRELKAVADSDLGIAGIESFFNKEKKFAEGLKKFKFGSVAEGGTTAAAQDLILRKTAVKTAKDFEEIIEKNRQIIIKTKGQVKLLQAEQKNLNSISARNPAIMAVSLDTQIEILERKRQGLLASQENLDMLLIEGKNLESIKALTRAIEIIRATQVTRIGIAAIKQQQRFLKLINKELAAKKQIFEINRKIVKDQQKIAANAANTDVSPFDALKLFEKEKEARKDLAEELLDKRLVGIGLEFQLLSLQIKLEKDKAIISQKVSAKDLEVFDRLLLASTAAQTAVASAAQAGLRGELSKIELEGSDLRRSVLVETIRLETEKSVLAADKFRVANAENLALEIERVQIAETLLRLRRELTLALMQGLDTKAQALKVDQEAQKLFEKELEGLREKAEIAGRLAGEGAGAAVGVSAEGFAQSAILGEDSEALLSNKLAAISKIMEPFIEQMMALGPEGELVSAIAEGSLVMAEAFTSAFEQMGEGSVSLRAGLLAAGAVVNSLAQIMAASARANVAGIDSQIEAEKKRDGKSKQSLAVISKLEKKKEAVQRKAFETNKKLQMANTVINTASAIVAALKDVPTPFNFVVASLIAALGAAQLAIISGTSFQGGSAGGASVPSSIALGERKPTVDVATSQSTSGELAFLRGQRGIGNTAGNFVPTTPGGFAGKASGGRTAFMAGEQGPELVISQNPSIVIPADDTANITTPISVNFSINTIDSQGVEDFLMTNRRNIIGMIRDAANARGEFFLENVDTFNEL